MNSSRLEVLRNQIETLKARVSLPASPSEQVPSKTLAPALPQAPASPASASPQFAYRTSSTSSMRSVVSPERSAMPSSGSAHGPVLTTPAGGQRKVIGSGAGRLEVTVTPEFSQTHMQSRSFLPVGVHAPERVAHLPIASREESALARPALKATRSRGPPLMGQTGTFSVV